MGEPLFRGVNLAITEHITLPDIAIAPDEATFIWGDSGVGKSTLLKFCNATATPYQGTMFYQGTPVMDRDTVALRREVMLVSQQVFLFDTTIQDNIEQFHRYREHTPPTPEAMRTYLDVCQLHVDLAQPAHELSGGQRQRLFTAIHLSFDPQVLLVDEPTSALDTPTAHALMGALIEHCKGRGMTMVVVSHDRSLVDTYATTTIDLGRHG